MEAKKKLKTGILSEVATGLFTFMLNESKVILTGVLQQLQIQNGLQKSLCSASPLCVLVISVFEVLGAFIPSASVQGISDNAKK
ncbi:MAG: hypothetical protein J0L94_06295 [Rhodothermia bacterium]|nr:hypothetical protein [Rhodothermia bacterium]